MFLSQFIFSYNQIFCHFNPALTEKQDAQQKESNTKTKSTDLFENSFWFKSVSLVINKIKTVLDSKIVQKNENLRKYTLQHSLLDTTNTEANKKFIIQTTELVSNINDLSRLSTQLKNLLLDKGKYYKSQLEKSKQADLSESVEDE
ncbi:hypothetical protein CDIK_1083 [Cucumispora dikerogammari]|nr:hypothetical protein CDIK_1083 [Cucumispora dikerogammari]